MRLAIIVSLSLVCSAPAWAQDMPAEYTAAMNALGKKGDFKDGVVKINIPRNDVAVTINGRPAPTPFGFGGWVAMTKGDGGMEVLMGDLVLTESEVNPVMSALLDNGIEVTALHNHFFGDQPKMFFMHVHGMGSAADLSKKLKPAIDLIDASAKKAGPATAPGPVPAAAMNAASLNAAALAKIIGTDGEQNGAVYKITIGRPDIGLKEHGASINARMGLNTWAAFTGSDTDAMVAGDFAMKESEVTPVLKAMRANGLNVVAIHHHMTGSTPVVIFMHYYGTGPAQKLAQGVRAALTAQGR